MGFLAAWANWISIVSVIPIEAIASCRVGGNGAEGDAGATPLHNASYDFNDAILATGARYFAEVVRLSLPR
ncbi:hypothetical protein ACIP1G_03285 [Pseudomonas sp. NPDC089392]|uniref:hypothetical protein n=1 Tax=Pseudomonas sp. NPDC089392 TaxID=3364459 RepID=UPI00382AC9B7